MGFQEMANHYLSIITSKRNLLSHDHPKKEREEMVACILFIELLLTDNKHYLFKIVKHKGVLHVLLANVEVWMFLS